MSLLISLLYLLLNIAIIALCAALIWWALSWFGIAIDPLVLKIMQAILAIIVIILIVSWFAGILPPRGILGRLSGPQYDVPFRLVHQTFASGANQERVM
jgi:hypothetical protein